MGTDKGCGIYGRTGKRGTCTVETDFFEECFSQCAFHESLPYGAVGKAPFSMFAIKTPSHIASRMLSLLAGIGFSQVCILQCALKMWSNAPL